MFITMNELVFTTQFMSPMSTGLDNCKCKSQIDNSSLNLTTIQVHDSCRNCTVHFLQGTVNLSSVKKLCIWGCLCFPVTCIFVIKKLAVRFVLKYCGLSRNINAVKRICQMFGSDFCVYRSKIQKLVIKQSKLKVILSLYL